MKFLSPLALFPLFSTALFGATIASFDGGAGTPLNLSNFSDPAVANGGPSIQAAGGNPGGFFQITNNVNGQHNYGVFDLSDPGAAFTTTLFTFQFRFDNLGAGGADGMSFSYFPTQIYGATGPLATAPFTAEDPAAAGVLGFGFDTWGNAGAAFDANGLGADYSEISLFFNGALISRVDDTRLLTPSLNLKDTNWHTVNGTVNAAGATVSLSVDGNPIFTSVPVPGLVAVESRVGFGSRTGGANERTSIDNVNVQFVPEPGVIGAVAMGGLLLLRRRRR